jgi:hypothetical protein
MYGYTGTVCTVRYPYRLPSLAFVVLDGVLDGVDPYVPVFDTGGTVVYWLYWSRVIVTRIIMLKLCLTQSSRGAFGSALVQLMA